MLNTNTFPYTQDIGGQPVTVDAVFSFESMEECLSSLDEVKFETEDLVVEIDDGDGNITLERPSNLGFEFVEVSLNAAGVLSVDVFDIRVVGQTSSLTPSPGSLGITTAEVLASHVDAGSGVYSHAHINPMYAEGELTNVLTDPPSRLTATFSLLGKKDATATELLLVWDGDMVLRRDI
jgi:hypothetical protein